jgi:hypothetical protein
MRKFTLSLLAFLIFFLVVSPVSAKDARLYRITKLGSQVLFAVLSFYQTDFPTAFQNAQ